MKLSGKLVFGLFFAKWSRGVQISVFPVNFPVNFQKVSGKLSGKLSVGPGKLSLGSFLSLGRDGGGVRGRSEEGY